MDDAVDHTILAAIARDGRATLAQLSEAVGLSTSAVQSRLKRLESRGVITGYQAVLDPELFVIGGGVADLGERLLQPVRTAYRASLSGQADRPVAGFAIATLGNDAGLIGVADLARIRG